jgi:hypothetical protein
MMAIVSKSSPQRGRWPEGPEGEVFIPAACQTSPSVGCADTSPAGGGISS